MDRVVGPGRQDGATLGTEARSRKATSSSMGLQIVELCRDEGVSGAKSREHRPAFDALCKDAARRGFGTVMAWSVDRLGRSLQDLVGFLSELKRTFAFEHDAAHGRFLFSRTTPGGPRGGDRDQAFSIARLGYLSTLLRLPPLYWTDSRPRINAISAALRQRYKVGL
jgi:hypothetical protein